MEEREMYIHKYIHIVKMRSNSGLGVLVEITLYNNNNDEYCWGLEILYGK